MRVDSRGQITSDVYSCMNIITVQKSGSGSLGTVASLRGRDRRSLPSVELTIFFFFGIQINRTGVIYMSEIVKSMTLKPVGTYNRPNSKSISKIRPMRSQ